MRLAKFLAASGVASRRAAEEIVRAGRVTIDDVQVVDPARDVGASHIVALDGKRVQVEQARAVYAVNKPRGVVSTARDPQGRRTVVALVPSQLRLYPVGRLDADSTGLILLTNDGELAHRLMHPSFEVPKTYRARVFSAPVRPAALAALRSGVELEDGRTSPARVSRISPDTIELTIHEGRKRQVKRMCEAVGHRVAALERVGFGPLVLGDLRPGAYRRLGRAEVDLLTKAAGPGARRGETASS